jgi:hypothetical protein
MDSMLIAFLLRLRDEWRRQYNRQQAERNQRANPSTWRTGDDPNLLEGRSGNRLQNTVYLLHPNAIRHRSSLPGGLEPWEKEQADAYARVQKMARDMHIVSGRGAVDLEAKIEADFWRTDSWNEIEARYLKKIQKMGGPEFVAGQAQRKLEQLQHNSSIPLDRRISEEIRASLESHAAEEDLAHQYARKLAKEVAYGSGKDRRAIEQEMSVQYQVEGSWRNVVKHYHQLLNQPRAPATMQAFAVAPLNERERPPQRSGARPSPSVNEHGPAPVMSETQSVGRGRKM